MMNTAKEKRGIILITTILIVSFISAVILSSIYTILRHQDITFNSRESTVAIYAADTGIECALLWDVRGYQIIARPVFATSTPSLDFPRITAASHPDVVCEGKKLPNLWSIQDGGGASPYAITTFKLSRTSPNSSCSIITVTKRYDVAENRIETSIVSKGYNVECADVVSSNKVVERAIRVDYRF